MDRIYNFSAGPAMIPTEVMRQAQADFLSWNGTGMSIMEVSHRGKTFKDIAAQSMQDLRDLLSIPDNYHVLFLQGGGRSQFSMVPMNLLDGATEAAYIRTGIWGNLALEEAKRYCQVNIVADSEPQGYTTIPDQAQWNDFKNAAYLHYCDNETIHGLEFSSVPDSKGIPLVSDMSSNILSRTIDISKFGLIYACAQKNIGPAGVTIVIVRDDLLKRTPIDNTPSMFRYKLHADNNSLYNTAPTYAWYMAGLVFKWIKEQGGVSVMEEHARIKSQKLYDFIDANDFYTTQIDPRYRSRMNVSCNLPSAELSAQFIKEAETAGMSGLKGHRLLGGIRASVYNAMPEAGVDTLIQFMDDFAKANNTLTNKVESQI